MKDEIQAEIKRLEEEKTQLMRRRNLWSGIHQQELAERYKIQADEVDRQLSILRYENTVFHSN
jgi:hypothetical protein